MKTKDLSSMRSPKGAANQIGRDELSEESPAPTGEELLIWAEYQRTLYAAGELPPAQVRALMEIPGWTWERTTNKGLADACWFFVRHDAPTRYIAGTSPE